MGGKEAKERRRLKRLEEQEKNKQTELEKKKNVSSKNVPKRRPTLSFPKQSKGVGKFPQKNNAVKKFGNKHPKNKMNDNKKKKPKHLKRKLEQLSSSTDNDDQKEYERLRLIQEEFEKKKQKVMTHYHPTGKEISGHGEPKIIRGPSSFESRKMEPPTKMNQTKQPEKPTKDEINQKEFVPTDTKIEVENTSSEKDLDEKDENIDEKPPKDENHDNNEDEEDFDVLPQKRERGRRRRGRKSSPPEVTEKDSEDELKTKTSSVPNDTNPFPPPLKNEETTTTQDKKKRRCIGRKPVTSFEVGKQYDGKVVYIKNNLGVFIDIGCHSDAFCHISELSDDYVSSIDLKPGDSVQNATVVQINRAKKQMTVSFKTNPTLIHTPQTPKPNNDKKYNESSTDPVEKKDKKDVETSELSNKEPDANNQDKLPSTDMQHIPTQDIHIDPETMTPAELKRARKLQRRAERRRQQELTGIAS